MADKKLVEAITSMEEDFAKWYTDIVKKAELIEYTGVRGCVTLLPYGYTLWENIQKGLDARFKENGIENVQLPMFIPESLLNKEKDHVEGFAPEVAWVTHGGSEELPERLCIRPTSETLFCDMYSKIIHSYRDLPKLYNQWCSVVRWEKTTRPFLRTIEFFWQEGHTAHATEEEAESYTQLMLNVYADFCEQVLAIPMIRGKKTDKEKFAGANATYSIEALMHDGKALQSATSHYFGDGFAKAFDITFADKDNKLAYVYQTSWGLSARIIGAIIMVHGDDSGLMLPPMIAPVQVMIVPIMQKAEGVIDKADEIRKMLSGFRVKVDSSDKGPGFKFAEQEMRGIPLRIEVGPKDIEAGQVIIVRRDTREKTVVPLNEEDIVKNVTRLLHDIQKDMFDRAKAHMEESTRIARDMDELEDIINEKSGFVKAMWCGDRACEDKVKERTTATSRNIPFVQDIVGDACVCCGKAADKLVIWGKAY